MNPDLFETTINLEAVPTLLSLYAFTTLFICFTNFLRIKASPLQSGTP